MGGLVVSALPVVDQVYVPLKERASRIATVEGSEDGLLLLAAEFASDLLLRDHRPQLALEEAPESCPAGISRDAEGEPRPALLERTPDRFGLALPRELGDLTGEALDLGVLDVQRQGALRDRFRSTKHDLTICRMVEKSTMTLSIRPLDIRHAHALAVADLPPHHRDPFDRLLVAQALLEKLALVSSERAFEKYTVELVW